MEISRSTTFVWRFEEGPPASFKILEGAWNKVSTPPPARMRTGPAGVTLLLPENAARWNLYLAEARAAVRGAAARAGAFLGNDSALCGFQEWPVAENELAPGSRHVFQSCLHGSLVFDFVDGQLTRVRAFADVLRPPYFNASVAMKMEGLEIEQLGFQLMDLEDLPQSAKDWKMPKAK